MFTLRCTSRLEKRLRPSLSASPVEPTTRLGDWYANLIRVGRVQLVLCVSERTLLPVVVAAAPIGEVAARLRVGLGEVLGAWGVSATVVAEENAAMEGVAYGKTANRQVVGVMVEFARMLDLGFAPLGSLVEVSVRLAEIPCSPLYKTPHSSPDRATAALFGAPPPRT